jgi:hypothetical protein
MEVKTPSAKITCGEQARFLQYNPLEFCKKFHKAVATVRQTMTELKFFSRSGNAVAVGGWRQGY